MDFNKAVGVIRKDLDEVSALLDQLSATPGSQIAEIELARSRVRSATEMLRLLPQLNGFARQQPEPAPDGIHDVKKEPAVDHKTESAVAEKEMPEVRHEADGIHADQNVPEVKNEAERIHADHKVHAAKAKTADKKEPEIKKDPVTEKGKSILADKFASASVLGEKPTAAKQDEVITSVLNSKAISDIGAAIGINDRFYFIRELFSGDSRAYHDTIGRLNSATSLGEAMKILDESTVMGSDPAAQTSFVDVVRRKFNVNV